MANEILRYLLCNFLKDIRDFIKDISDLMYAKILGFNREKIEKKNDSFHI